MLRRCAGECDFRVFRASEESVSFADSFGEETLFSEASTHNDAHTTPGPHVLGRSAYRHD